MTDLTTGATTQTATVDVKSSWLSKINWTQAIGWAISALAVVGVAVPAEVTQHIGEVVLGIQGIVAIITWFFRTFRTTAVTKAAVK